MQNEKLNEELKILRNENARLKAELFDIIACASQKSSRPLENKLKIHKEQLLLVNKIKSLGILINGVAHDINNPNNFISINAVLLQRIWKDLKPLFREKMKTSSNFIQENIPGNKLEKNIDDLLSGIKDGSERIEKIVESLTAYISSASSNYKEAFDLHDAIGNVQYLLKNQIMKATDKFMVNLKSEHLFVNGFQQKIEQVIINILQNSCQALSSREQSIQIETNADLDSKLAIIKIIDSGVGIEEKYLSFITNPFFTTKREIGGIGLGLSVSSLILEEHNGYLNFWSEANNGTTVEIVLPLVKL